MLQEPPATGQGYWYRMGYRTKDNTLFVDCAAQPRRPAAACSARLTKAGPACPPRCAKS